MKKSSTKTFWYAAGISLGLHAMLFVAWLYNFDSYHDIEIINNDHSINISLIAEASSRKTGTRENRQQYLKEAGRQAPPKKATGNTSDSPKTSVNTSQENAPAAKSHNKDSARLYKLLYSAINQQKYYPVSALRLRQQGKVRVSFNLFNNGNLDNIIIAQSSGYHSLDNAALLAVKRIQPFHPAAEYVASVKDFQLDIIFQL